MVGAPHFFSNTTLRPFGPSVTRTASASLFMPASSERRACSSKAIIFGIRVSLRWNWELAGRSHSLQSSASTLRLRVLTGNCDMPRSPSRSPTSVPDGVGKVGDRSGLDDAAQHDRGVGLPRAVVAKPLEEVVEAPGAVAVDDHPVVDATGHVGQPADVVALAQRHLHLVPRPGVDQDVDHCLEVAPEGGLVDVGGEAADDAPAG